MRPKSREAFLLFREDFVSLLSFLLVSPPMRKREGERGREREREGEKGRERWRERERQGERKGE